MSRGLHGAIAQALLPIGGYWSLLIALCFWARSLPQSADIAATGVLLIGLPVSIFASVRLLREARAGAHDLAMRDELTGVGNRRAFLTQSEHLMRRAKPGTLGLILLDVDGLKSLNDNCGHQAGDELLEKLARHISRHGKLFRIGGDEFAVLVDRSAGQRMTFLMQALEPFVEKFESCGHSHEIRVSHGTTSNREDEQFQHLFRRADDSLIQHKRELYQGRSYERRGQTRTAPRASSSSEGHDEPPPRLRLLS